jgi:hypothetical protein
MNSEFDYDKAFSRNIGWVTKDEQQRLRGVKIAIAGLGGVGGHHLLTLTRLGIGQFHIADFDHFEVHNFNRQAGAMLSTIGQPKAMTMMQMALDINPSLQIRQFETGVTPENIDDFLKDVDIYVDGIDYFCVEARRMLFAACKARGIHAVTAAPLGMGVGFLYFKPGGMSFEEYFLLEGESRREQLIRFLAGLAPKALQRRYLMVRDTVNFDEERGPSTGIACDLCAGFTGAQVLKILLKRGKVRAVPWSVQFDAYEQKLGFAFRPGGNRHPIQKILLKLVRAQMKN